VPVTPVWPCLSAGHACLALFEHNATGFFTGLGLIALGAGGIKPLVASFVGDQFDQSNKHLAKIVFDAFYWIINFGSLFASLLMPLFLKHYGPSVAFGIPGLLMFVRFSGLAAIATSRWRSIARATRMPFHAFCARHC